VLKAWAQKTVPEERFRWETKASQNWLAEIP
jgi:hypothetical protein